MPGNEIENKRSTDLPDADKAARQTSDDDHTDELGDVDPKYSKQVEEAYEKKVGSNKERDERRSNTDSGSKREE